MYYAIIENKQEIALTVSTVNQFFEFLKSTARYHNQKIKYIKPFVYTINNCEYSLVLDTNIPLVMA